MTDWIDMQELTPETMKLRGHYNWKGQPDRLIYLGRNWSGNGFWHQFRKIGDPRPVWCEVLDSDLPMLEETVEKKSADDVARGWRVRFSLPDGYFTFVDVGSSFGSPISKATVWRWAESEVANSKGEYIGIAHVYSIDHIGVASDAGAGRLEASND
jgi:hypothetical protein